METLYFPEWSVVIAVRVSRSFSLFVPSIAGSSRVHACIEIGRVHSVNLFAQLRLGIRTLSWKQRQSKDIFDDNTRGINIAAAIIFKPEMSRILVLLLND